MCPISSIGYMKLVFVSNYLNHHQIPLCNGFRNLCDEFSFIATDTVNIQGYQHISSADYVIEYNDETKTQVLNEIRNADVVIFGSTPNSLINERMRYNKLSFLYSERFYKRGLWRCVNPKSYKFFIDRIGKYRNKNMYTLCASAFFPLDLKLLRFPVSKCFRWGYFPDVENITIEKLNKKKASFVWAGRLIEWKHPEMAVKAAMFLKARGYDFSLRIIGDGPLMPELQRMVFENELSQNVMLLGSCSHDEVLKHMRESSIFLFTSDKMEGWGAVLNEAMGSACVPVCGHLIGSVPFLVKNEYNGLIFRDGNQNMLNNKIEFLLKNEDACRDYSRNAYKSIHSLWNAQIATQRFIQLSQSLLKNEKIHDEYIDGPCSKAKLITENWRYKKS